MLEISHLFLKNNFYFVLAPAPLQETQLLFIISIITREMWQLFEDVVAHWYSAPDYWGSSPGFKSGISHSGKALRTGRVTVYILYICKNLGAEREASPWAKKKRKRTNNFNKKSFLLKTKHDIFTKRKFWVQQRMINMLALGEDSISHSDPCYGHQNSLKRKMTDSNWGPCTPPLSLPNKLYCNVCMRNLKVIVNRH